MLGTPTQHHDEEYQPLAHGYPKHQIANEHQLGNRPTPGETNPQQ